MSEAGDLWTSAGLIDAGHRLVWASGDDAVTFLHDLLSQDVAGLAEGRATRSLLLAPNGRLRAVISVARIGDAIAMISTQSEHVLSDLTRFRIRVDVDLAIDSRPVSMLWGPEAELVLEHSGWPTGPDAGVDSPQWALRDPVVEHRWFLIGEPDDLDVTAVDAEDARVRRIEVGEPEFGTDIDETTIPNEAFDLAGLVDFEKGCYLGQELVERIDARGRRVKRLTGFVFEDGPVPAAGATLTSDDASVGVLTSAAYSPHAGAPIGLGTLRTEVLDGASIVATWESGRAKGIVKQPPLLTDS